MQRVVVQLVGAPEQLIEHLAFALDVAGEQDAREFGLVA